MHPPQIVDLLTIHANMKWRDLLVVTNDNELLANVVEEEGLRA